MITRAQGLTFPTPDGGIEVPHLDLIEMFFDGEMLWDNKALELSLKLHFSNIIDVKVLRENYGLVMGHHKMIPFIERYVDLAQKQMDNSIDVLAPIPIKECAERANQIRMTPNEAESIMRRGGNTPQDR